MLCSMVEQHGPVPEHGFVSFQNTGREDEATYRFVDRVSEHTGIDIVWLEFFQDKKYHPSFRVTDFSGASRNGEPFLMAMKGEGGWLPNRARRWCTRKMKRQSLERYMKRILGWKSWISIVGMRADESKRVRQVADPKVTRLFPLSEAGWKKEDVAEFWAKMPFDLELPLVDGKTIGGNCRGCFLKSEHELALFCKRDPAEFAWWEKVERESGSTFKEKYSYADIRSKVEKGDIVFDLEDYFCQKDDGECTG